MDSSAPPVFASGTVTRSAIWVAGAVACAVLTLFVASHVLGVMRADAQGPDWPCKRGYVWREAGPDDRVCVAPGVRMRTVRENAAAAQRTNASTGPGPQSCHAGYVWREAYAQDVVCVKPKVRLLVPQENANAARFAAPGQPPVPGP